jgi:hypothetical protein
MSGIVRHAILRAVITCGLAASALLAAPSGEAATRADEAIAQALFDEAKELALHGQFGLACPKFEESQKVDGSVGTLLNLADCYENTGRLVSAWSTFLDAAAAAREAGQPGREQASQERAAALAPRLPKIVVHVTREAQVPGLTVLRDGQPIGEAQFDLPVPADAGTYVIGASAPGRRPWQSRVVVGAATITSVTVPYLAEDASGSGDVTSRPFRPSFDAQNTIAWVAAAIGVGGLALGTGIAIGAKSENDQANAACPAHTCASMDAVAKSRDAVRDGNLATIVFAASGAALAAGAVLWFTAKPAVRIWHDRTVAQLGVGLGALELRGAW